MESLKGSLVAVAAAVARLRVFLEAPDTEWVVRYPPGTAGSLELVPLTVAPWAAELLFADR